MPAERTCVVCREVGQKGDLLRFVLRTPATGEGQEDELEVDALGRSPGRGAYCHLSPACFFDERLCSLLLSSLGRGHKGSRKKKSANRSTASSSSVIAETFLTKALEQLESHKPEDGSQRQKLCNELRRLSKQREKLANKSKVRRVRL